MSDINLEIAEALEKLGLAEGLAWAPALKCPQGHLNFDIDNGDGQMFFGPIGSVCLDCMAHGNIEPDEYIARGDDPAWHPEWRIGRVPHDFSKSEYLLLAVEAWQDQSKAHVLMVEPSFYRTKSDGLWDGELKVMYITEEKEYPGDGESWGTALRMAFHEALTEGVGE